MSKFKWRVAGLAIAMVAAPLVASADPINILFVGNSFTGSVSPNF